MSDPRNRPIGETAGSEQRTARRLIGEALNFDLNSEIRTLREEPSFRQGDRNARTLVQESELRVTLTVLRSGSQVKAHQAPAWVTVQTLEGHVKLTLGDRSVDLPAGHLLTLEPNVRHDVEALADSAFMLTIAGLQR